MRLWWIPAALGFAACTSSEPAGPAFGSPPPMSFKPPPLPAHGGPATPVQRRVSQSTAPPPAADSGPGDRTSVAQGSPAPAPLRAPAPANNLLGTAVHKATVHGTALTFLAFDDRRCDITIADKDGGLNSEWQTAAVAGAAHKAIAAINGGFFTREGKPLGLVVENGKPFGSWNASSSLTSGVLVVSGSRSGLARRQRWSPDRPAKFLLQAGPLLLDFGETVSGLSDDESRPRSFIAWDSRHHWVIGHARSATLAGLARALATQPVPGIRLRTALNLDGGSSSDLWIAPVIKGGPVSTRQFWNKPVRNYVLVTERTP